MVEMHGDPCGIAQVLAVIGGRWKGPIIWWLSKGPKRFSELRREIDGVSARMLTAQLRQLEASGVVERCDATGGDHHHRYQLTPTGEALVPLLDAISAWAARHGAKLSVAAE